jgi:16S rRNA U516 pseudouridylate synthase RsuA-like enzyme
MRMGLVGGGIGMLGGAWLLSAVFAAAAMGDDGSLLGSNHDPEDWAPLFVPLAGPFIAIGTLEADSQGALLLALDGIAQLGGLTLIIVGATVKRTYLVRTAELEFELAPTIGPTAQGLGLHGSF